MHRIGKNLMSSHGVCIERLVLGRNSFLLGKCYTLLHSGMDFQWIWRPKACRGPKSHPSKVESYLGKSEVLMVVRGGLATFVGLCKVI